MKKVLLTALFMFSPAALFATEFKTGLVAKIYPTGNTVYFRLKDDSCNNVATNEYYYFVMDNSTNVGQYAAKNWFSMLLAAGTAGKQISVAVPSCAVTGHKQINYLYQNF